MRTLERWTPRPRLVLLVAASLALAGCAHRVREAGPRTAPTAPEPDSVTVALWHMDEAGGTRIGESGPFRLEATAGLDARSDFGRYRSARRFVRTVDSFVYVPYNPMFDSGHALTVEAWVYPVAFGQYEDTPIAARWTPQANERSWLFAIAGSDLRPPAATLPSPGYHYDLMLPREKGHLLFAYLPEEAGPPRAFFSAVPIELNRWTHVAATFDGAVVRFYIDGRLDSQYATAGRIRPSPAGIVIGNFFDPHWLTTFGGDLRLSQDADPNPYYAFEGLIDELRISSAARTEFPTAGLR